MTKLRLWAVIFALAGGALLLACGGDDDGDNGGNGDGDGPTATQSADDSETPDGGDGDGDGGGDGDASSDLQDLAERLADKEFTVTYNLTGAFEGGSLDGTLTLYWKPPDSWRVDISGADVGEATLIAQGGSSYLCAVEGGEGTCFESPLGAEAIPVPFLNLFADPDSVSTAFSDEFSDFDLDQSSREVAGQDATCFSGTGDVEGESGTVEICFSDDGILLLISSSSDISGDFSMEATSVEDSVSDADFEPPYDILDIPTG